MIYLDFETYSPVDIGAGSVKYMRHPDADIVCMGYKIDDGPVCMWTPGQDLPEEFHDGKSIFVAHNALFDYLAWNIIGKKYKFPEVPLARWRDSQALVNRYTLPGALAKAGDILGVEVQKSRTGKALIKKISCPTKDGRRPKPGIDFTMDEATAYLDYCRQDVESMCQLIKALPADELAKDEQQYWLLTQRMNLAGLPVDIRTVEKIFGYIDGYVEELTKRVPEITENAVDRVTQVAKIRNWMLKRGVKTSDLRAGTVDTLLAGELPADVREILILRQMMGRSSTAKYKKIMEMEIDGRVYNNLQYYGTSTGRWAGRGFQLQNLPRASVPDPDVFIDKFNTFKFVDDPVNVAKALIRPMICAPERKMLIVSDYFSIENRLLAWVAGDEKALELFRSGGDQYVDMACFMYKKKAEDVTKAERQIGKIIILGCGYGMGAKRFVETALGWGVALSQSEAIVAVDAYRERYRLVKKLWYRLKDHCVAAIQNPGRAYIYNSCAFEVVKDRTGGRWLTLKLPSRRLLFYKDPYLEEDDYGTVPGHHGINPYSKKWSRLKLIPGRITENVIQALARDIMAYGLRQIDINMPEVTLLGTNHDEAIGEIAEADLHEDTMNNFNYYMCFKPDWAEGLPLEADGYIAKRYKKG